MITDNLGSTYVMAAVAHGAATDSGNHKEANAAHTRMMRALKKLREASDHGEAVLTKLIAHENPYVRCWAATHLLPLNEGAAISTLSSLSSETSFAGFDAKMVLREWKAGRLKIP